MSSEGSIYQHPPSLAAAALFTALFGATFIVTVARGKHHGRQSGKRGWLSIAAPALIETVGYGLRIGSVQHQLDLGLYIASYVVIVLAPQLSAIVCYQTLNALIADTSLAFSSLEPDMIGPTWLTIDFVSGVLQGAGAGQQLNEDSVLAGLIVALIGMLVQFLAFVAFTGYVLQYASRVRRSAYIESRSIRRNLLALLLSCLAHNIRFLYRVVEFAVQIGLVNPPEYAPQLPPVYEYVFDSTPIFIALATYAVLFTFDLTVPRFYGPEYFCLRSRIKAKEARMAEEQKKTDNSASTSP